MNCRSTALWIAPLVAVSTLTVSCASAPPQTAVAESAPSMRAEVGATDETLANAVYSELNASPMYYYRHIDVRVNNGVADLSGYVWSTDALYQARRIAMNVPGITAVTTNQLQLERNGKDTGVTR